jgi:hypothetical protein
MRENRPTINESMSTVLEIEGREQLVRHIFDTLEKKGVVVTDQMIHVTPYGFDDRINWDEHIIVVDRFGVFGFTDGPCPDTVLAAGLSARDGTLKTSQQLASAEVENAYGRNK